jgi:hypothetical protein
MVFVLGVWVLGSGCWRLERLGLFACEVIAICEQKIGMGFQDLPKDFFGL